MKNFTNHIINVNSTALDALKKINLLTELSENLTLFVCDNNNKLLGTLTDGDIRRGFLKGNRIEDSLSLFYLKDFYYFSKDKMDINLLQELRNNKIKLVPLLDEAGIIIKVFDFTKRKTILPIDAVIMAGGRGERLRPLTDSIPKPMLKIGNKPIIEHNVDNLISHGIDNFFITVNYLSEQIIDYFGNGEKKDVKIKFIKETIPLGTIGSVSLIENYYNETILIMNSDLFTNINYEDFYLDFVKEDADMSIATIPYNVDIPYAILNIKNENVLSFQEKPSYTYYANAGIYLVKRNLLKDLPINKNFNATDFIQTLLDNKKKVIKYPIIGYWIDIGKKEDYNKAQEFIKHINHEN